MGIVPSGRVRRRLAAQYTSRDRPAMRWCRASTLPIPLIAWTFAKRIRFGNERRHSDRKMSARRLSPEVFSAKEGRLLAVPHVELIQRGSFPFQPSCGQMATRENPDANDM